MSAPLLTQELLKHLVHYDPETGIFTWLRRANAKRWNSRYEGKVAGFDWKLGNVTYRSIRIFDYPFLGHRLAFLYMTGAWPAHDVDHKDRDGTNNRWANLRPATKTQNAANTGPKKNNRTGLKGVSLCRRTGRFRATISVNRKQKTLGYFDTAAEAHEAYRAAAVERLGEYARAL